MHEFGRWTRAAIPIGAGHRSFQVTSFYGPPKGDVIRKNYADKMLKLLFECSRDFGSQMPAVICCDLNRNPDECAFLRMAMARTGWTDVGQLQYGEEDAPPTYCQTGAAHKGMTGPGCTRIDLLLANQVALAAFESYEQIYGQGIAKHAIITASFHLPTFGAKVTLPKTPSSMAHLERHDLPEAVKEDLVYFALPPAQKAKYLQSLEQGEFTEAYDIWNRAAEGHLTLQLNSPTLPLKYRNKGKVPRFQNTGTSGQRYLPSISRSSYSLASKAKLMNPKMP